MIKHNNCNTHGLQKKSGIFVLISAIVLLFFVEFVLYVLSICLMNPDVSKILAYGRYAFAVLVCICVVELAVRLLKIFKIGTK